MFSVLEHMDAWVWFEPQGELIMLECCLQVIRWTNIMIAHNEMSQALVVTANTSIIAFLLIAAYILWGLKQGNGRHLYGSAISMVWFLIGIAVELQNPTQPIYNQFSDGQIMSTQILAGLASTLLSSLMALRMIKTIIKSMGACQGNDSVDGEEDITTDYVHA